MFGVLAIDKPGGMTSRDVVNRIQKIVRPVKVGHTGTLDPLATGVLLLAIGPATRLVEFSQESSKGYEADFRFGQQSDTLDVEGTVVPLPQTIPPTQEALLAEVGRWIGKVEQVPPRFSAVHVGGRRAYDLARQGEDFELKPRPVEIHSIDVQNYAYPRMTLRIECGSGTYIRSLGSDIARRLGSDAVMSRLVRTNVGAIALADCVQLDALSTPECVTEHLHPPQVLLETLPQVTLVEGACRRIRNGQPLATTEVSVPADSPCERFAAVDEQEQLVAVLQRVEDGRYRSLRVFQRDRDTSQPSISRTPQSPES